METPEHDKILEPLGKTAQERSSIIPEVQKTFKTSEGNALSHPDNRSESSVQSAESGCSAFITRRSRFGKTATVLLISVFHVLNAGAVDPAAGAGTWVNITPPGITLV